MLSSGLHLSLAFVFTGNVRDKMEKEPLINTQDVSEFYEIILEKYSAIYLVSSNEFSIFLIYH